MKIFLTSFLILTFLFIANAQQTERYVKGDLLVQMKAGRTIENLTPFYSNIQMEIVEHLSKRMNIWLVRYNTELIADDDILFAVRQNSDVKAVQFNHIIEMRKAVDDTYESINNLLNNRETTPNDPRFNEQWALKNTGQSGGTAGADIKATLAWDFETGGLSSLGDTIVIAIIDGGAQLTHPDIPYWKNWGEIPGNSIDDDGNGYIDDFDGWNAYNINGTVPSNSHGTHVSGIAGARGNNGVGVSGVNWNAKIMPIAGSTGQEAIAVRAYNYVLDQRATYNETNGQQGAFVVVTNASFGVDYGNPANFPIWCAIYDSLGVQGVLSCGATANLNINIDVSGDVPTACPSNYLIAVTNTTNSDAKNSGAAYGLTTIDLGAPGTSILSTESNGSYSTKTGTSMATPTVAGGVALMMSAANPQLMQAYKTNPSLGALNFKQILLDAVDPIPALNNITVTGGRLNVFNAVLAVSSPPDTIAPTQVTDLAVSNITSNSLILNWSTPLDTTRNGVVGYVIKKSTSPIVTNDDFNNAESIEFNGTLGATGAPVLTSVSGLSFSTNYYFALKSFDTWGNTSVMSNVILGETWGAPVMALSQSNIFHTVEPNQTFTDSIVISNISTGNSTLDYNIELTNNTFPTNVINMKLLPLNNSIKESEYEKEELNINYGSSLRGNGGPDNFGYVWIDSDEPNGPVYTWNDISTTGTQATNWVATGTFDPKDEGYAGPFDIGFNFKFYGVVKTQVYVSSNGVLVFAPLTGNIITNATIPNTAIPNDYVAPFWDDLDGRTNGTVHYKQEGNKFIVQFTNWQKFSAQGSLTFQIVLTQQGQIFYYYNNMVGTLNSATVGIENSTGTDGLQVAYNTNYVKNNHAVKISADPEWVVTTNYGGTLNSGNSSSVVLTFNTTDLIEGNYSMDMVLTSNDPQNSTFTIPILMIVSKDVPVELASFTANVTENNVILNWSTASETNNMGFEVLRKVDSRQLTVGSEDWNVVGFVNGNGTTTELNNYSFVDVLNSGNTGNIKYRLKQIDFDGKFEYSNIIEVEIGIPSEFALLQNYPNPFNPSTEIRYQIKEDVKVSLIVYDILGNEVATLVNENQSAGIYNIKFDGGKLSTGVYYYTLKAGDFIQTKKMMLMK